MMKKIIPIFILLFVSFISAATLNLQFVDLMSSTGVNGVNVHVYNSNNVLVVSSISDATGYLNLSELQGEYTLRAFKEGYNSQTITQKIELTDVDLNVDMFALAKINVEVNNASNPVNSIVRIQTSYDEIIDYFNGATGVLEVPAGSYTIVVYAENHVPQSINIDVGPSEIVSRTLTLEYSEEVLIPTITTIEVELNKNSVIAGEEVQHSAKATYSNGLEFDITSCANWDLDEVGKGYETGIVTQKVGAHEISATYLGKSDSETLIVEGGEAIELIVIAPKTTIVVKEKIVLSTKLKDIYSNEFETNEVICNSTCGVITGKNFSSTSTCTATITCVYNLDNNLNSSVNVKITSTSDSDSSSSSKKNTNTTNTTTTTTTIISTPKVNETNEEVLSVIKFVLPENVSEGDAIEIVVTDSEGNPVEGIEITIMDPNKEEMELSSDSNGMIRFETELFGNYFLYSEMYTIMGTRVIYVQSKLPEVSELNEEIVINPEPIRPVDKNETQITEEKPLSVFDTLTATISGEMSIIDALKSTVHLWILVAIILLSAALFFVVYTYVIGKSINHDDVPQNPPTESVKEGVKVSEPIPPVVPVNNSEESSELEEKLRKLKELKDKL